MTDKKKEEVEEEDLEYVQVKRLVEPLGSAWSFDRYKGNEEERWRNHVSYQIKIGYERKVARFGKIFKEVLTGCELLMSQGKKEQEQQREWLDSVDIPIKYGVKGLSDDMIFFALKEDKSTIGE